MSQEWMSGVLDAINRARIAFRMAPLKTLPRGIPKESRLCVLARALKIEVLLDDENQPFALIRQRHKAVILADAWHVSRPEEAWLGWSVLLPAPLSDFVHRFDSGFHPSLVLRKQCEELRSAWTKRWRHTIWGDDLTFLQPSSQSNSHNSLNSHHNQSVPNGTYSALCRGRRQRQMLSKYTFSALAGMALLALPATALAWQPGVQMIKHHEGYHKVCDVDGDDCRWVPNAPASYHRQCDADGDDCRWVPNVTFGNWNPHYQCDADGDDCHWVGGYGPQYWRQHGGYDYGAPLSWYRSEAPSKYNLAQRRDWLIRRRQVAYSVLKQMRARGDVDAQRRMQGVIGDLNTRIARIDRQMSSGY